MKQGYQATPEGDVASEKKVGTMFRPDTSPRVIGESFRSYFWYVRTTKRYSLEGYA
jgi:hypothetical protein